jgi:hypothetical protein
MVGAWLKYPEGNIKVGRRCRERAFLLQLTAASATGHVKEGDDTSAKTSCCLRKATDVE